MPDDSNAPRPYRMDRFGILSPYGDIWSCNTFGTEDEARQYIADYWRGTGVRLDTFKVVPVEVVVSARSSRRDEQDAR